jgi:hypothetical protein
VKIAVIARTPIRAEQHITTIFTTRPSHRNRAGGAPAV